MPWSCGAYTDPIDYPGSCACAGPTQMDSLIKVAAYSISVQDLTVKSWEWQLGPDQVNSFN